jgi:chromosome partitioning protein
MSFYAGNPVTAETAQRAIRHSETAGVDYIPADINLANAETLMVTMISKEHILRRILTEDVIGAYDFVLIDCLPSLGTLLINALTAADRVLIPVQTQKFSMDGLQSLEALTQLVKANTNPKLNLIGVLPTMVDRTKVSRTAIETLNEKYGEMLFRTSISKSIEAAKSSENGTPLCLTGHKLGQEYDELAQEVLSRC